MTVYQTRAQWNARPWTAYVNLDWTRVTKFIVHYNDSTPGARRQSPRSIQDFCMDVKGHSDVDYNELERDGVVYQGRHDHVGGHTLNNNSTSYGLCVIGEPGTLNDRDKQSVRERYEYACGRAGRRLEMLGHRDAPGNVGTTDCPGNEIEAWVKAGMPYPGGNPGGDDEMFCQLGDKNDKVTAMQALVVMKGGRVGNSANALDDVDGSYGPATAAGLGALIGGDGKVYWPFQYAALHALHSGTPGPQGPKGDPGTPGKTPTQVTVDFSGVKVTAPVTATS